jgi:hypothetical protein
MKSNRTIQQKIAIIAGLFLAMFLIPLAGEYIHSSGVIPADYFSFRPREVPEKAPFDLTIFLVIAVLGAIGISIYLVPKWYGFKKPPENNQPPKKAKVKLPAWFWIGLIMWASTGLVLWTKAAKPKLLIDFAVIPLFWGLAMMIDGIVYKRNGGSSIINDRPKTMLGIGMASIGGWLLFEYLNFFVRYNWYYPANELTRTSAFFLYAILGSAGLLPMTIEVYALLRSFKGLRERYSYGPKLRFTRSLKYVLLIASLLSLFPVPFLPDQLFFVIWIAPLIIIVVALDMLGQWTPFRPIAEKGDWAPFALICMAQFIVGICTECMNYFSGTHDPLVTNNPDYWVYSIPYVNAYHIFEMPALGLLGYVPFGIYFWAWFLLIAFLLDIPPYLGKNRSYIPD